MKKIVAITVFFLISFSTSSQTLTNGNLSGNCTGNGFSAPSCIKGWAASHGTPTVLGNINNNTWAWLTVSKDTSEGIYTNYNFTAGKTYEISFKVKAYTNIEATESKLQNPTVNIRATSALVHSTSKKPQQIEENSQLIWSKAVAKPKAYWQTIKMTYIPTKNNTQIWFYPSVHHNEKLNDTSKVAMEIDDIEIKVITESVLSNFQESNTTSLDNTESVVSNPVFKGYAAKIFTKASDVNEIYLIDFSGYSKKIEYSIIDRETINFLIDDATTEGIYTLKILKKNGTMAIKKIIVQ